MGSYNRVAYFYYNGFSYFDTPERKMWPNYMIRSTKVLTVEVFKRLFNSSLTQVRYVRACKGDTEDYASHHYSYSVICQLHYIQNGGWHFTSVLPKDKLRKKYQQIAGGDKDYEIPDV